jgi:hypothetical protein
MRKANRHSITATGKALLTMLCAVACVLSMQLLSLAQEKQARDARYYAGRAMKAYREKDYAALLENMKMANSLRPTHQTYMYNLAAAYALVGDQKEALDWLRRGAQMGLVYPADQEPDFDSIRETAEFKAILKRIEANQLPVVKSTTAFTVHEKGLVPESVAYDSQTQTFYLGSVYRRKILSIDRRGEVREFATERDGLWSVMGMKVDGARRILWVCTAAHPQMANYREGDEGRSGIYKFDLRSGKLVRKYLLSNQPKRHWLGDLVLNSRGDIFATDSISPAIYTIRHKKDELELFIEGEPFVSPQGLDFTADEKHLLMADYSKGIFLIDLQTKKLLNLTPAPDSTLLGIDGLYRYKDTLVAVQNGVNPHRVVRLFLNKRMDQVLRFEIIEANHPLFDEPTLGVIVKDTFYYIANSQWGAIDEKGQLASSDKLREPVILKMKL